jgi:ATP-dependent helicase/nuclease subunit A
MSASRYWPAKPIDSRWTDEQWAAITADGSNLLVAAAAGSGKTAVLVERIISRIADESKPLDVDAMLVATFTKAAAAEMKERIRHALEEALERDPESRHLRRQIALLPRASVTTLHSFCLEIVERYAPLIELDPGFRMANVTEAELLRMDTLDELFEERYASEGESGALSALADHFGGERSDEPLHRLVLELHEFAGSHPWPEHWLRDMAGRFETAEADTLIHTLWVKSLREDAMLLLQGILNLLRGALRLAHEPGGPDPYIETLFADVDGMEKVAIALERGTWEDWQAAVADISFGRLKACKGEDYDPVLIERVKSLRDSAKKSASRLSEEWLVRSPERYAAELHELAPAMGHLAELAVRFGEKYEEAKRAKGLLDFGDLEHYALRILRDPSSTPAKSVPSTAALSFRDRFSEIYLDEYQDTNEVQEAIVSLISRKSPGNVFMVGDVKQSIYRFRLAEPGLFLEKYKIYDAFGESAQATAPAEDPDGLRIDLARNFRSRREILNAVNHVFRLIMREPVGEMNYDGSAELIFGNGYPEADEPNPYSVELILLDKAVKADDEADNGRPEADIVNTDSDGEGTSDNLAGETEDVEGAQLEARCIATEIRKLMGLDGGNGEPFTVYDGKAKLHRPTQFRDIVILLRAVTALAPAFLDELKAAGIPAYADLATGYFAATEVDIMLSLLAVIDNPHQDIPLAGVLRSPIAGLTAEQLARIRLAKRGGSFWEAVNAAAGSRASVDSDPMSAPSSASSGEDEGLESALAGFVRKLEEWRDFARWETLGDLLGMLYRETSYYDYVGGMPGGVQRQANLRALVNRAVQYEQSSKFRGLFRFLRFLGRMRDTGADLGAARALGESENVVRIVSIHRSKGLEFPVVFVAGLGRNFNRRDLNGAFLKHKQLGFGPRVVESDTRVTYPTLPQLAIKRKMAAEMLAEEMRVLYVALTRPKEKLYLIGTSKDALKQWEQWTETASMSTESLPTHSVAAAGRYLDWLGPAAVLASELTDSSRRWTCTIVPASDFTRMTNPVMADNEEERVMWNAVLSGEPVEVAVSTDNERIRRILSWEYDDASASRVAAKTSITAMKNEQQASSSIPLHEDILVTVEIDPVTNSKDGRWADEGWLGSPTEIDSELFEASSVVIPSTYRLRRPRFMSTRQLTPAERGTAYHLVMQHLPLQEEPVTDEQIEGLLDRMTERLILSKDQRQGIQASEVAAFCCSPLYSRLRDAVRTWREVPFTYGIPASTVYPGVIPVDSPDTVIIQGVIDCLFAEEDGLVLVDYKTDVLRGADAAEAAEKHRYQVAKYGEAVSVILGRPIKEAYVYFFDGGHTVRLI